MGFNWRLLEEGDYDNTLVKWWKDWRWTPPPKDMLPQEGRCGIMVSKEDDRKEAIELLIETLSLIAEDKGCKYIFTSLKNKLLINSYEKCGYVIGSTNCTEMIKKV